MKYFLIAGEPSGDQHGSELMKSIQLLDASAEFRFLGGDLMEGVGGKAVIHTRELAFMGFTQVITRLSAIRDNFSKTKSAISGFNPDVVIPIDYGGFNLRLIRWLRANKFRTAYYITPKVWAWMPSRAKNIAANTDISLCVLPFETGFLQKYRVNCAYVGNPVRDYILPFRDLPQTLGVTDFNPEGKPVVALLPGSRAQEIRRMLPLMASMAGKFTDYQFVVAGHPDFSTEFYQNLTGYPGIRIVHGKTRELLRSAQAALVTSGTATLESALLGTPQVVCYSAGFFSWLIARLVIRVKYISLVNLILERPCVDELIQFNYNSARLGRSLWRLLNDNSRVKNIREGYQELEDKLGISNASATAAEIVCRLAAGA